MGWKFRSWHLQELDSSLVADLLIVQKQKIDLAMLPLYH